MDITKINIRRSAESNSHRAVADADELDLEPGDETALGTREVDVEGSNIRPVIDEDGLVPIRVNKLGKPYPGEDGSEKQRVYFEIDADRLDRETLSGRQDELSDLVQNGAGTPLHYALGKLLG